MTHMADCAVQTASASAKAEILGREADHRIKNSLQIVISLLHRQAASAELDSVRDALQVASARVTAVAQIHAALHAAAIPYGVMPELDLKTYLEGLCVALTTALGMDGSHRSLQVNLASWAVSPAVAQSLGLAVSELLANALRHAFWPDRPGTVNVTGSCDGRGGYQLCIEDDGCGLARGFDLRHRPESGLGLRLVNMLANRARARVSVDGGRGTRVTLALHGPADHLADTGGPYVDADNP